MDDAGNGNWWFTRSPGNDAANCPQGNPCTWSEVKVKFPNAGILSSQPVVLLKAGSGWSNFDGNVDAFTIGVTGSNTTYDFEPYRVATDKEQCKNGGWQNVKRTDGSGFKNQGQCIQYVNTGK
jgi:hypothetical protein